MSEWRLSEEEIELDARLSRLGYTIEWVRWGILSVSTFEEQLSAYEEQYRLHRFNPEEAEFPDLEHLAYAELFRWMKSQTSLSDEQLERVIWLARHLPLSEMGVGICHHLVREGHFPLSDAQFDYVCRILLAHGEDELVRRMSARRKYRRSDWSESLRQDVLAHCTGQDQLGMLEELGDRLTREDAEAFAEHGSSKAVRNTAKQMLESARFRGR